MCVGDLGGRRNIFGRWKPPCVALPGWKVVVLGNHDFTRFRWRERPLGADLTLMTLIIRSDPPLLVTHVPLDVVPDGCVNVHGHHHNFRPLEIGRWINVSVEHTGYRPLDVRTQVLPLATPGPWSAVGRPTARRRSTASADRPGPGSPPGRG